MSEYKPNVKIPCVYMRGGTSKAVFFHDKDLPQDVEQRDKVILSAFGSPIPPPARSPSSRKVPAPALM